MAQKYDKYGNPVGVSKNTLAKGNYYVDSNGNYKIALKANPVPASSAQISFSDPRLSKANADRVAAAQANDQFKIDSLTALQNQKNSTTATRQDLLNQAIMAEQQFRDDRMQAVSRGLGDQFPSDFSQTQAYLDNRQANLQNNAQGAQAYSDLKSSINQQSIDREIAKNAEEQAKNDLMRLILSGNNKSVQDSILAAGRSLPEISKETLQKMNLLTTGADGTTSMVGGGSSNFNPNTAQFDATMDERRQLKQDRALQDQYELMNYGKLNDDGSVGISYGGTYAPSNPPIVYQFPNTPDKLAANQLAGYMSTPSKSEDGAYYSTGGNAGYGFNGNNAQDDTDSTTSQYLKKALTTSKGQSYTGGSSSTQKSFF